MKKLLVFAAGLFLLQGAANAESISGRVKSIDQGAKTAVIERTDASGGTSDVTVEFSDTGLSGLQEGSTITVDAVEANGRFTANGNPASDTADTTGAATVGTGAGTAGAGATTGATLGSASGTTASDDASFGATAGTTTSTPVTTMGGGFSDTTASGTASSSTATSDSSTGSTTGSSM